MAINTKDPVFQRGIKEWIKLRDCKEGERAVKSKGSEYLRPFYPGMQNDEGEKWLEFVNYAAEYAPILGRVSNALSGSMLRYEPTLTFTNPNDEGWVTRDFGIDDGGIHSLFSKVIPEEVLTSRVGLHVDRDANGAFFPKPVVYQAEDILGTVKRKDGLPGFESVRLAERETYTNSNYDNVLVRRVRELALDEEGYYFVRIWEAEEVVLTDGAVSVSEPEDYSVVPVEGREDGRIYPTYGASRRFQDIPFWFGNGEDDYVKPILLDICDQTLKVYNKISYNNHSYFVYNVPTYFISGVQEGEADDFKTGTIWSANNIDAKISVVGGQPQILDAGDKIISQALNTIGALGAQMFYSRTSQAESADALKVRNAPEDAVVGMITNSLSDSLTSMVQFAVDWYNGNEYGQAQTVTVKVNNGINPRTIPSQDLQSIVTGVANGVIPAEVLFNVLEKNDILPDNFDVGAATRTVEQNMSLNGQPTMTDNQQPVEGENNNEENNQ